MKPKSVRMGLLELKSDPSFPSYMMNKIQILETELRLLRLCVWCSGKASGIESFAKKKKSFAEKIAEKIAEKVANKSRPNAICEILDRDQNADWDREVMISMLVRKIENCKRRIQKRFMGLLVCSFSVKFSTKELLNFLRFVSVALQDIVFLKADKTIDLNMQFEALKEKLDLFRRVFRFSAKWCSNRDKLKAFKIHIQVWAYKVACLVLLHWILDDQQEGNMNIMLSDLLWIIYPSTPEVMRMYLAILKDPNPSSAYSYLSSEIANDFVEFLLEYVQVLPQRNGIALLHDGFTFLITFLMDHPAEVEGGEIILKHADAVVNEAADLICSLTANEPEEAVSEEWNIRLLDFQEKVNTVKDEVGKTYAPISNSFHFPKTITLGFVDLLLQDVREFSIPLPEYLLVEELSSLRTFLKDVFVLQNEQRVADVWTRIVNVAYRAERAMYSYLYGFPSFWHDIIRFPVLVEEIKLVKSEMTKRMQDLQTYGNVVHDAWMNPVVPLQANIPMDELGVGFEDEADTSVDEANTPRGELVVGFEDELVVGFDDEAEVIVNRLLSGSRELDIVAISGMPGLGKTTLAKKICKDPSIQQHFSKSAWCCVSQTYTVRKLLLEILRGLKVRDDDINKMPEEKLAEEVKKRLSGYKYLIVIDDIWDVEAWNELKFSFPDQSNGSKILFTTRIMSVALHAKSDCIQHPLHPLSDEKCWVLLEKKLFQKDGHCLPELIGIGKRIANNCKGLPLAVVVVAGLLREHIDSPDWWEHIADRVGSGIREGCMDIVELSYRHLADNLKPCFLYFGLFQEDKAIKVQKLTRLWISEGFVHKSGVKCLEVIAKECLMDLVVRSLVIVTDRSSDGGIKTCRVHDLLRDFCLAKGEEEKFFKVLNRNNISFPSTVIYNHYRVCIQTEQWKCFRRQYPSIPCVSSLLFFPMVVTSRPYHMDHCPFGNLYFLHVLDLEDVNLVADPFPKGITTLILLRYLVIRFCGTLLSIPPSLANLCRLETLCILGVRCSFSSQDTTWTMKMLRHLEVSHRFSLFSGDYDLDESSQLDNIQTFSTPEFCQIDDSKRLFKMIPGVRKLKCRFCLYFSQEENNKVLEFRLLSQLESLNVSYEARRFTAIGFNFPSTLKRLTLSGFHLPWSEISAIGKLPNLEVLKLLKDSFDGKKWKVKDEEFLKLRFLKLYNLDIEQWKVSDDSFPWLQQLVVEECFFLKKIPSCFGTVLTLQKIQLIHNGATVIRSAKRIQTDQLDSGNEHFELLIIEDHEFYRISFMEHSSYGSHSGDQKNPSFDETDPSEVEDSSDDMDPADDPSQGEDPTEVPPEVEDSAADINPAEDPLEVEDPSEFPSEVEDSSNEMNSSHLEDALDETEALEVVCSSNLSNSHSYESDDSDLWEEVGSSDEINCLNEADPSIGE